MLRDISLRIARSAGLATLAIVIVSGSVTTAWAQKIKLTLQDAPLTILKDNTATKKIVGIPSQTPGSLRLDFKWHAMTFVPNTFNKLKVELLHGSNVLYNETCYSIHAISTPRCLIIRPINQTEANASGDWKLRITNNSAHDVNGFNILKEITELNPAFITLSMDSSFQPDCTTRDLSIPEMILAPHETKKYSFQIPNLSGEILIRAKWHVDVITPNIFNPAVVRLLRNGEVVTSDRGYSIHSDQKDKIVLRFNVTPLPNATSSWQVEVTNDGPITIKKFGIEKGSDSNPLVPEFKSTFKPSCN
jgi:hypothetical protein